MPASTLSTSRFPSLLTPLVTPSAWLALAFPVITVVLGMEMLRALLPLAVWVLRDRFGWEAYQVGILAFAVFATGYLVGFLYRLLGPRATVAFTAGGLALLRLASQAWTGDPLIDLSLAFAASVLFILFLAAYLELPWLPLSASISNTRLLPLSPSWQARCLPAA